jgi:hypothetical protein
VQFQSVLDHRGTCAGGVLPISHHARITHYSRLPPHTVLVRTCGSPSYVRKKMPQVGWVAADLYAGSRNDYPLY